MGFAVHVLVAGRTVHVPALMPFKGLGSHFLLETIRTTMSTKADRGLGVACGFAGMVNSQMCLETSVSEKVPMTLLATSGGFETSGVSMKEIGALFLATGPAKAFFVASMLSLGVIGFPTVGTYITGPEKSWQTGNDIVMVLVVQQDQLFVLDVSKRRDMEGPVSIHQDDLVLGKGRGRTEGSQGIVAARTWRDASFVMEPQREFPLQFASLSNAVVFRVLVHSGFGNDEGSSTTEFILILDADDRFGIPC